MNRNQFDISSETRRTDIVEYIINHQGCTRADLEKGLEARMSKKTIHKWVAEMIEEEVIHEEVKKNSRNRKLYINENNLLVSVPRDLDQFKSAYISLYDNITEKIIVPSMFVGCFPEQFDISGTIPIEKISQLSDEILSVFFRMVDSVLLTSIMEWPKRIQDKEDLKSLYQTAFTKIVDMLLEIAEYHETPKSIMNYDMRKLAIKKLEGGGSLFKYWEKFKGYGMRQEIEKVIDSLWNIDKPIQPIVYKDLEYVSTQIRSSFKNELGNWRELFETLSSLDPKPQ
jgi:hypothetical protein